LSVAAVQQFPQGRYGRGRAIHGDKIIPRQSGILARTSNPTRLARLAIPSSSGALGDHPK
jgi:hypothetical protein